MEPAMVQQKNVKLQSLGVVSDLFGSTKESTFTSDLFDDVLFGRLAIEGHQGCVQAIVPLSFEIAEIRVEFRVVKATMCVFHAI